MKDKQPTLGEMREQKVIHVRRQIGPVMKVDTEMALQNCT